MSTTCFIVGWRTSNMVEITMDVLLRFFIPLYLLVFFGAAFLWRSVLVWKRTGINPYTLGNNDTAHDFIGVLFRLTLLASALIAILYAFLPVAYPFLAPLAWLQQPMLAIVGSLLLLAALVWVLVAQAQMGQSWRIGIDDTNKTDLVQTGLFRLSRNPIFLGMRVMLLGFFLVLPNAATLAVWLLGDALMQIQVRLEEEHLIRLHGDLYRRYCSAVRRWI